MVVISKGTKYSALEYRICYYVIFMNNTVSSSLVIFSCFYLCFLCQQNNGKHLGVFISALETQKIIVLYDHSKNRLFVFDASSDDVYASQIQICTGNQNVYLFINRKTMNNCLGVKHWLSNAHSWINTCGSMWSERGIRNDENAWNFLTGIVQQIACWNSIPDELVTYTSADPAAASVHLQPQVRALGQVKQTFGH